MHYKHVFLRWKSGFRERLDIDACVVLDDQKEQMDLPCLTSEGLIKMLLFSTFENVNVVWEG